MFRDNSLVPTEAIRLAALGFLAEAPRRYGDLAIEIRHFTSRVVGPSLDLMGTSLELLRYEGLIEAVDGQGMTDNAVLRLTAAGRAALVSLLQARLRSPAADLNRLALLLKLRFLPLLPPRDQQAQTELIRESCEAELARLQDLRRHHAEARGAFLDWLDQDIAALEARLARLGEPQQRATPS
jgi:DNA-binding PadR family transcriptional regulator